MLERSPRCVARATRGDGPIGTEPHGAGHDGLSVSGCRCALCASCHNLGESERARAIAVVEKAVNVAWPLLVAPALASARARVARRGWGPMRRAAAANPA